MEDKVIVEWDWCTLKMPMERRALGGDQQSPWGDLNAVARAFEQTNL